MKKTRNFKRFMSCSVCVMLVAAIAPLAIGCNDKKNDSTASESISATAVVVGEGQTTFGFTVTHKDGSHKQFEVATDKKTVGEALLDAEIISGDDGEFGLYVKTVDGETLDFETDGYYWSFLINSEYAQTGVDMTNIEEGQTYEFKAEKG